MRLFLSILTSIFCALLLASQAEASSSQQHTIKVGDEKRDYLLYQPTSLAKDTPVPLVIMLHGGFGSGSQAEKAYGWDKQADSGGFVVAYPDGLNRAWNAGGACCGKPAKNNVNDLGFITQLIKDISKVVNIDPARVYLTGMSNGAAMSYRYACEGEYPIAAIGVVSGSLSYECKFPRAISVMEIHGVADQNIPLAGGFGSKGVAKVDWLPVHKTLNKFRDAAQCEQSSFIANGAVKTASSRCVRGKEVILITIDGAGHQWPGSKSISKLAVLMLPIDPPSEAIDATSKLWGFFNKHKNNN